MTEETPKRRLPVRTATIPLDDLEGFEGWWLTVRLRLKMGDFLDLSDPLDGQVSNRLITDFVAGALVDWNFVDELGEPIPATPEGVRQVDLPVLMEVYPRILKEIGRLPLALNGNSPVGP